MSDIKYFTEEGLKKLEKELHHLRTVERPNIINQIAEARDKGDLSENAEYDAAKEAQGLLEAKITQMEILYSQARIIDTDHLDTNSVRLLTKVGIRNIDNDSEMIYSIVPESESDLTKNKISVSSPIGEGLLGKEVGEIAEIQVPNGTITFEVISIELI